MSPTPPTRRIEVRVTDDAALLNAVLRDDAVYAQSSDDHAPPPGDVDCTPLLRGGHWTAFGVFVDGDLGGAFFVVRHTVVLNEVHTAILPIHRGVVASRAAEAFLDLLFEATPCRKLITLVPSFNRPAARFARLAGLRPQGVITRSFLKGGVLHDQDVLGITRDEHLARRGDRLRNPEVSAD